ncbi:uncharacterized protein isoform X2 [Leptinotarsa decemlineata]|uniref:uncharacterized protein isoform X2 n=1 Tax=Leptinotarsa decemlineata TaxID=7539 RepID=UPI003D307A25
MNGSKIKLTDLQTKYDEEKCKSDKLQDKITFEVGKYNENINQLEKLIIQLRKEKEELENSVEYLQNNLQKMHNDLNETRKSEKEAKDMFNSCLIEKTGLAELKFEQERKIETLNEEKDKLTKEINHVNSLCEKILADFETNIKSSIEKEDLYKKEIQESKQMILDNSREIEQLSNVLTTKQSELQNIISECNHLKQKEKQHVDVMRALENQKLDTKDYKNKKEKLENELFDLKSEHENTKIQLANAKEELESLYKQMKVIMEQKEDEYRFYKKHMDDTFSQNESLQEKNRAELNELKLHLNDLTHKLENERSAYSALSQIHKDVSAKFIKSIKDVVDEKSARQEAEAKLEEAQQNLEILKTEKSDLQQQVNILLDGLNDEKNRINTLTQERDNIQKSLEELQKRHNEILRKCLSLENQIRGADLTKDTEKETLKEQIDTLKRESEDNQDLIFSLKQDLTDVNQKITGLEFQKSELILRLHEMQRKFETEKSLCQQLKNTHKLIVTEVLKLKDGGNVTGQNCNSLLLLVQSNGDVCEIEQK